MVSYNTYDRFMQAEPSQDDGCVIQSQRGYIPQQNMAMLTSEELDKNSISTSPREDRASDDIKMLISEECDKDSNSTAPGEDRVREATDQSSVMITSENRNENSISSSLVEDRSDVVTLHMSPCDKATIMVGLLYSAVTVLGIPLSFGTFYPDLLDTFGTTRWETTLVQSIFLGMTAGAGIPVGFLIHRFGAKRTMVAGSVLGFLGLFSSWFASSLMYLIITVGVVTGFGGCVVYVSASVIAADTFVKKKGIAVAAITAISGFGAVLFPKLLDAMRMSYGLRGTFLICSALYLNILVPATAMSLQPTQSIQQNGLQEQSLLHKLRGLLHPLFIAYCSTSLVCIGVLNSVVVVTVDFAISRGLTRDMGINCLLIINCLKTVSSFLVGFTKLIPRAHGAVVFCVCSVLAGVGIMLMSSVAGYGYIIACMTVYAVGFGGVIGIQNVAVLDIVDQKALAFGIGMRGILVGLGNPALAVVTGWLFDETGSYTLSFLVIGTSIIIACLLTLVTIPVYRCIHK